MAGEKTCFVVMGFNKKTDYATGRTLDLDKTYRAIIKPAVQAAGMHCVRADEIVHSGIIDVPMFQQLLEADLVIADVSTMNPNALYELGVRHALRPFSTIVIGESRIKEKGYPFDLSHLAIRDYVHLGDGIDYEEAVGFSGKLAAAIQTILAQPKDDSPVYVYLTALRQPTVAAAVAAAPPAPAATRSPSEATLSMVLEQADAALGKSDFAGARALLEMACRIRPNDPYLIQRLALATYKSKQPTVLEALRAARDLLSALKPEATNDPETLGLWGAVHKRLWEVTDERAALDTSVFAYEKGFYIKNDYYNGINLAFLLNLRATLSSPAEAVADFIDAERVRRRVAVICRQLIAQESPATPPTERYWVIATLAEALRGYGEIEEHEQVLAKAFALAVPDWMRDSTREELNKLATLLADSPLKYLQRDAPRS